MQTVVQTIHDEEQLFNIAKMQAIEHLANIQTCISRLEGDVLASDNQQLVVVEQHLTNIETCISRLEGDVSVVD